MANNSQAVIPDNIIYVVGDIPGGKIQDNGGLGKDGEGALYVKTDGDTIDINSEGELEVIGGGHEYKAGTGIEIANEEISVDTSVVATQTDLEGYTPTASLANVALSGDYADLANTPNLALKEDVANKAQTIDATSTTDYPSSAGVAQYVSSAVATATATFLGNFTLTELGLTYPATEQQITAALASHTWPAGTTVDNNDYVYVEIQNPQTTGVDDSVQRYKYNGTVWAYEYTLNNSSFTSGEVAALESGVNATKVGNYDAHIADTTIHVTSSDKSTWNAKQDAISDLETIRTGAGLGATAVQPGDLATVASTGDYEDLLNKPTIPATKPLVAGTNVTITENANDVTIAATDTTYSAGTGIDITNSVISADTTVLATKAELPDGVPAVTSSDNDKVLKATYSGGVGSYSWEQDSGVDTHTITVADGNPYGLASKTMRVQFNNQNYDPTNDLSSSDFSCIQVSSSPNVWDITFLQTWSFGNKITYDSCGGFSVLDFNVYGVNSIEGMFYDCTGITSLTILNATGVQNMEGICRWCTNLGTVNISGVGSVKTLADAFYYCRSPLTVNITGLTNVESMYNMFGASGLTAFPNWSNETFGRLSQVSSIFGQCRDVQSGIQDMYTKLSGIPTITSHGDAFYECGANGPAASELNNIPSSWGGRA